MRPAEAHSGRGNAHVLILTQYYRPEEVGAAIFLAELVDDLKEAGHRVTVLTAFPNYPDGVIPPAYRGKVYQQEVVQGTQVLRTYIYATSSKNFWQRILSFGSFTASSLLGGLMRAPRVDVVYTVMPPLPLGLTAIALARSRGARVILNIQDIYPDVAVATGVLKNQRAIAFFQRMERFIYRHADRFVVISEGFRQNLLAKGVPDNKVRIVSNWADPEFVRPQPPDAELRTQWGADRFAVVYSGSLSLNSSVECLVEAAEILRGETFRFVISGEGIKKQRLEEAVALRKLDNVQLGPFAPLHRYPAVLASADLNVVTLNHAAVIASVPSKIFKMMASGRPVLAIAPPESEITRLVGEAGCGFCVSPGRPAELAATLRYALAHRAEIEQMGRRGRQYLEQHLARKLCTAKIGAVVSELAD